METTTKTNAAIDCFVKCFDDESPAEINSQLLICFRVLAFEKDDGKIMSMEPELSILFEMITILCSANDWPEAAHRIYDDVIRPSKTDISGILKHALKSMFLSSKTDITQTEKNAGFYLWQITECVENITDSSIN